MDNPTRKDEGFLRFDNGWEFNATHLNVTLTEVTGYCLDGQHWFYYNRETKFFNVHIPKYPDPVDWATPDVVHKDVGFVSYEIY